MSDMYIVETETEHMGDGSSLVVMRHPQFPGCYGHGATEDEARVRLRRARAAYLEMGVRPEHHPLLIDPDSTR